MKRKLTPLAILCIAWFTTLSAQQAPQYSLYMLNPYAFNPGYAGLDNTLTIQGVYRKQWTNLKGAPETQHINAHMPLYVIRSGIGLKLENESLGAHNSTQAMLSYNYQLELGSNALLSAGVGGGYVQYSLDGTKLRAPEGEYAVTSGIFQHHDDFLPEGRVNAGGFLAEAGLFFQMKGLELGASLQPAFAPRLETAAANETFRVQNVIHYFFYGAYQFAIGEDVTVKPSVLSKTDLLETQTEISAVLRWRDNIFAGASYRGLGAADRDAAVVLAGWRLNDRTTLAYAFDVPLSPLNAVNRGSHELLLRYSLNKPIGTGKLPPIIYNPRFF